MSVGELSSLFGHDAPNLGNAVANRHDCSSAGSIEVTLASCGEDKTSFAANGLRIRLQETSRKDGVITHLCFSIGTALGRFCTREPATISTIGRSASKGYSTVRRAERIHNRGQLQGHDGYFHFSFLTSTVGGGNFIFKPSRVSVMTWETARLRNHFLFAGMTNQGASSVLHRCNVSS